MLIEALIASLVLAIGTAGIVGLIGHVARAGQYAGFQAASLEVFSEVAAQIQAATCFVAPGDTVPDAASADPGLMPFPLPTPGVMSAWWPVAGQNAPVAGSAIVTVGDLDRSPRMRVDYRVLLVAPLPSQPAAFEVHVRVRQIMYDSALDSLNVLSTYWIRTYPLKKTCPSRTEATSRGGGL